MCYKNDIIIVCISLMPNTFSAIVIFDLVGVVPAFFKDRLEIISFIPLILTRRSFGVYAGCRTRHCVYAKNNKKERRLPYTCSNVVNIKDKHIAWRMAHII